MDDIFVTPDMCMKFMIWSYYYHGIMPNEKISYKACGMFSVSDVSKLDTIKDAIFRCYGRDSIVNMCKKFDMAKQLNEPCPFKREELDVLFANVQ